MHLAHHVPPCSRPRPLVAAPAAQQRPRAAAARARKPDAAAEQQAEGQQEEGNRGPLAAVLDLLLHRAASSLTRGPTTCLTCKGQGSCTCPLCKGARITDREHSRMNQVRHTAQKFGQLLQGERSNYNTEWLQTNRCRRCHGYGAIVCPTCAGLGMRHPRGTKPSS